MRLRPRSLFGKIFLWFCVTGVVASSLVVVLAAITGAQPFGKRWMAMTQDLYARSAVDFYATGGREGLRRYLETIGRSGIEGHLIVDGADALGGAFPEHCRRVYLDAV